MDKVFLDASYAIALASTNDRNHEKAVILAKEIEDRGRQMVTTYAVIFEIGNSLAKLRYRQAAVDLIDSIEKDPNIEIIPISERLYQRAFDLYRERMDKEWGLTDCISFTEYFKGDGSIFSSFPYSANEYNPLSPDRSIRGQPPFPW